MVLRRRKSRADAIVSPEGMCFDPAALTSDECWVLHAARSALAPLIPRGIGEGALIHADRRGADLDQTLTEFYVIFLHVSPIVEKDKILYHDFE